jgi:uncharacterized phage-associated protein
MCWNQEDLRTLFRRRPPPPPEPKLPSGPPEVPKQQSLEELARIARSLGSMERREDSRVLATPVLSTHSPVFETTLHELAPLGADYEDMEPAPQIFRLRLDSAKTVEAIDFLAREWPGITQYYLGKVLYFADRDHCLDWGRTITGDRYVAMAHGPVPSRVYDLIKAGSGEEDELLDALSARLSFQQDGNKIRVHSKNAGGFDALSESDITYLSSALSFCRDRSFSDLRNIAHAELPWQKAVEGDSNAPPMDLTLWFEQANLDRKAAGVYLREHAICGSSQP